MLNQELEKIKERLLKMTEENSTSAEEHDKFVVRYDMILEQLRGLIQTAATEKNEAVLHAAIILLGQNTTCADDLVISDEFLEKLLEKQLITETDYKLFNDNTNLGEWQ